MTTSTTTAPTTGQKVLAGNWKMYKTKAEAAEFFKKLGPSLAHSPVRKIVAASPTLLESTARAAEGTGVSVFAQNCAYAKEGALTGEVSPLQLADIGIRGTLIGHSERRQFFGETTETCAKRLATAFEAGLEVIYCIGESHAERTATQTHKVLEGQLQPILHLRPPSGVNFMIAYEPVWAIGTGLNAGTEQIAEAHAWIQKILDRGNSPIHPILYGGSVKPANFKEIAGVAGVAGGLVGGASLDAESFRQLHEALL